MIEKLCPDCLLLDNVYLFEKYVSFRNVSYKCMPSGEVPKLTISGSISDMSLHTFELVHLATEYGWIIVNIININYKPAK